MLGRRGRGSDVGFWSSELLGFGALGIPALDIPKGKCAQILYTLIRKFSDRDYSKAEVYKNGHMDPWGMGCRVYLHLLELSMLGNERVGIP